MKPGLFGLPWLLPAPADFKTRARAALAMPSLDQAEVRKLAAYALDLSDLETMAKVVHKHRVALIHKAGLTPVRLGIASSHTMHYVAAALPGTALRHNLVLDVLLSGLGQTAERLMSAEPELGCRALDAILIALDYRVLGLAEAQLSAQDADTAVRRATDYVAELAASVRATGATCILQTLVPPASPLFGNLDGRFPGSVRAMIERFNENLVHGLAQETDVILDAAFLASAVGLSAWNCARDWNHARLPGALDSTPLYADHICRLLGAARGRTRKCLVMDLDDTLWGGTIRHDGLQGIRLGQGTSVGEAHLALQHYVLDLRRRGVILAICSDNSEAFARLPFRAHPAMVLKEDHIAFFFANESDKVGSIREIAALSNIGIDSVVFLDHNPAERALIRELLPEVAVPELTSDPADYAALLSTAGYFEAATFALEDLNGPAFQSAGSRRFHEGKVDSAWTLESLNMVATVSPFSSTGRDCVLQLLAANQYNLTNKYYSRREIEASGASPDKFCLQISLTDRFGEKGVVQAVIFARADDEWRCELWLLCGTAFERRVDELALASVAQAAYAAGASRLVLVHVVTEDNAVMADHFTNLGFKIASVLASGDIEWILDLPTYQAPALPFTIVRPN